jgi:hypothetical protein
LYIEFFIFKKSDLQKITSKVSSYMWIGDVDLLTYHIWIGDMCIGGFPRTWYLKPWKKSFYNYFYISSKIKAKNLCCRSFPDMAAMWASRGKQNTGKNLFFFPPRNEDDIFGFCSFSEFWCQFSLQILCGLIFVRFSVLCFYGLPLVRKCILRCKYII